MPANRRYALTEHEWDVEAGTWHPEKKTFSVTPQKLVQFMGFLPHVIQQARDTMWLFVPAVVEFGGDSAVSAWMDDADVFRPFRVPTLRFHPSPHLDVDQQALQRPSMFQSRPEPKCSPV